MARFDIKKYAVYMFITVNIIGCLYCAYRFMDGIDPYANFMWCSLAVSELMLSWVAFFFYYINN